MIRTLSSSVASIFALAGFVVSLLAGWIGDNHLATILERSLFSLVASFAIGWVIGLLLDGVVARHAQDLRMSSEQMELASESGLDQTENESEGRNDAVAVEPAAAV